MKDLDFRESLEEDTSWWEEFETAYAGSDSEASTLDSHQSLLLQSAVSLTDERRPDLEQRWAHRMLWEIEGEMDGGKASVQDRYDALVDGLRWLLIRAVQEQFPLAQAIVIEECFVAPLIEAIARHHTALSRG